MSWVLFKLLHAILSIAIVGSVLIVPTSGLMGVDALQVAPRTVPRQCLAYSTQTPCQAVTSSSLSTSNLFGTRSNTRCNAKQVFQLQSTSSGAAPNGGDTNNSNNAVDAEITKATSPTSSTSFLRAVDNFGMKLKPWALSAYEKSLTFSNGNTSVNGTDSSNGANAKKVQKSKLKAILYKLQSNILWMAYILYRGYRGFFVILPAVFKEVYRQLEESDLVVDVYGDEDEEEREYAVNANAGQGKQQPPMKLRTRITISVLSMMLTLSYVVSGAFRVLGEIIQAL